MLESDFDPTVTDGRERAPVVMETGVVRTACGSTESRPTDVALIQYVTCELKG